MWRYFARTRSERRETNDSHLFVDRAFGGMKYASFAGYWSRWGFSVLPLATASAGTICEPHRLDSCNINGGIFAVEVIHPAGTGVIDSFVRVQKKGTEQGYNTTYRKVQSTRRKTRIYARHPAVGGGHHIIGGIPYATVLLDINEPHQEQGDHHARISWSCSRRTCPSEPATPGFQIRRRAACRARRRSTTWIPTGTTWCS